MSRCPGLLQAWLLVRLWRKLDRLGRVTEGEKEKGLVIYTGMNRPMHGP